MSLVFGTRRSILGGGIAGTGFPLLGGQPGLEAGRQTIEVDR